MFVQTNNGGPLVDNMYNDFGERRVVSVNAGCITIYLGQDFLRKCTPLLIIATNVQWGANDSKCNQSY